MGLTQITTGGVDDNINIDSNTLKVDGTNNRVGIGDAAPSEKLNVAGNVMLEGSDQFLYLTNVGTGNSGVYIRGTDATSELRSHSTGMFTWEVTGSEKMRINSSGNVGIGTSSPQRALVVSDAGAEGFEFFPGSSDTGNTLNHYDRGSSSFIDITTNADKHIFGRADGEKMRIDSSGRLLVGASTSPSAGSGQYTKLASVGNTLAANGDGRIMLGRGLAASGMSSSQEIGGVYFTDNTGATFAQVTATVDGTPGTNDYPGRLVFSTTADGASSPTERLRISQNGNVGINSTLSSNKLRVHEGSDTPNVVIVTGADESSEFLALGVDSGVPCVTAGGVSSTSASLAFRTADNGTESEVARFDSSGRLLVGTSSNFVRGNIQAVDNGGGEITIGRSDTSVSNGNDIGHLFFCANDSDTGALVVANISCFSEADYSSGSAPANLRFSVCEGGSTSSTERMRLTSNGHLLVGKTAEANIVTTDGTRIDSTGGVFTTRSNDSPILCARQGSDGDLIQFFAQGNFEGSISVSGSSVSYNGGHLARWSQLAGGVERTEILRGSVLSNLDEMCEWGEEDNEQLNRMKVSDVEGDPNVAGVFQAWDDDDDTYTNDFYCAMTGDFVIRIAQGTTVARGDLLMSAGDGTAKPQDDDIVRSKTIAKVTSTTVSTTYTDGSYCVPCVLMAC